MAFGSSEQMVLELVMQARDEASEGLRGLGENLMRVGEIAGGIVLGDMMFRGLDDGIRSLRDMASSMIDINATAERLNNSLTSIYGSATEAARAMDYVRQNALNNPFTMPDIRQAATALAASGSDITSALPAVENAAALAGRSIGVATQAYVDAKEGLFRMMQRDLYITKAQLEAAGMKVDSKGHVDAGTFEPAFQKVVDARSNNSPDGLSATQRAMHTFSGEMSNLQDQWINFQQVLGNSAFKVIEKDLFNFVTFLQDHQKDVNAFATSLGTVLANGVREAEGAFRAAGAGIGEALSLIGSAIGIAQGVWGIFSGAVSAASGVVTAAVGGISTYLQTVALPYWQTVLGTVVLWWQDHGTRITKELGTLAGNVGQFLSFIGQNLVSALTIMQGAWAVGWGFFSGIVTGVLDIVTGNWKNFGVDMGKTFQTVANGLVDITEGLLEAMVRVLGGLLPHFNDLMHSLYDATKPFQDAMVTIVDSVRLMVMHGFDAVGAGIDSLMNKLHNLPHISLDIPGVGHVGTPVLGYDAAHDRFRTTAAQQAATAAAIHAQDVSLMQVGLAPGQNVTFGQTEAQALAALRAQAARIKRDFANTPDPFASLTDAPPPPSAPGPSTADAQRAGADMLAGFLARFKDFAAGGPHFAGFGGGGAGGNGLDPNLRLPVGNQSDGTDPKVEAARLARALKDAHDQFDIDLTQGKGNLGDAKVHGRLTGDIATIIKDMVPLLGFDTMDQRKEQVYLLSQIVDHTKATATHLSYGQASNPLLGYGTAREPGYGSSIIAFGMNEQVNQQETIRQLMAQNAALQTQNAALQTQLATDEQLLASSQRQEQHGEATAAAMTAVAREARRPQQSMDAILRSYGVAAAIR